MTDGSKTLSWLALAVLTAALGLSGCDRANSQEDEQTDSAEAAESAHGHSNSGHTNEHHPNNHAESHAAAEGDETSASSSPVQKLQSMDGRTPVPLLPMMAKHQKQNMRDHLVAIQKITAGIGAEDFEAIRKAAEPIGSSPEMKQMCRHMGAGAEGFTRRALKFHEKADGIIASAKSEDMAGVLDSLTATLQTCTSCHAEYKQKVVSPKSWQKKTGMAPPSQKGGMPHH